jgi:NAD(P)-dependent dehydrogenase (short-subunit alcohol dehydrogenase family)
LLQKALSCREVNGERLPARTGKEGSWMRLSGKSAIVTGAASGIGRAIALKFAAEGAHVVLADVREEPREGGAATLELIRRSGGSAEFAGCDIASEADNESIVARAVAACGRLDVIVNNAALGEGARLTDTSLVEWNRVLDVNLTGVFLGCRAAARQFLAQEPRGEIRGRIVNIASQHGLISSPGYLAYGVSKAGVAYMTRQVAADYARDGIVCNAVAPGKILTSMGADLPSHWLDYARSRTPWPRLGRAEDVASAVLFLASDEATYITGEVLMVDGGWMAA